MGISSHRHKLAKKNKHVVGKKFEKEFSKIPVIDHGRGLKRSQVEGYPLNLFFSLQKEKGYTHMGPLNYMVATHNSLAGTHSKLIAHAKSLNVGQIYFQFNHCHTANFIITKSEA